MRLQVSLRRPDVEPVHIGHEPEDRGTLFEQRREQLLLELPELVWWNVAKDIWLKHVGPRVDLAGDNLLGLLQECLHACLGVERDETVRPRVLYRSQHDGDGCTFLPMERDRGADVEVG